MKADHLAQLVLLDPGEASLLGQAVANLIAKTNRSAPIPAVVVLTLLPLYSLQRKLWTIHQRELLMSPQPGRPPKPRRLHITFDQLAALMHHREGLYHPSAPDTEHHLLHHIIGKFQQKSLSLSQFITF